MEGKLLSYLIVSEALVEIPTVPIPNKLNSEVDAVETNSLLKFWS